MTEKKEKVSEDNEKLGDMNKLLITMNEHKARFAKQVDKDVLSDIKRILQQGRSSACATGTEILNLICVFATGDTNATYSSAGQAIFASPETFGQAVKKADPSALEKSWI